jgi:hypothetical protein
MTHDYEDFSVSKMSDYWRVMEHDQLGVTTDRMGHLSDDILIWKLLDPDQLRNKREASFHMN